jgi:hypothetical protein
MRLFLISPTKPDWPYEILEYDQKHHRAKLRSKEMVMIDPNFYPKELQRDGFKLTQEVPECFKEPYHV